MVTKSAKRASARELAFRAFGAIGVVAIAAVAACAGRESPPPKTPQVAASASATPSPLAAIYGPDGGVAQRAKYTRFTITEFSGRSSEETGRYFEPAQIPVEACRKSNGGKLVARVRSEKGKLAIDAEPGASLDPTEKRCILEALQQTQIDDASIVNAGPSTRPTGFTSLITIEW